MLDWQQLGRHRYYLKDAVIFIETHGDVGREEMLVLLQLLDACTRQHGVAHVIGDTRLGASMSAEARRETVLWEDRLLRRQGTTVLFGASMATRVMVTLVHTALRLLGKPNNELSFVKTEAEAWQAIDKWQQQHAQQQK